MMDKKKLGTVAAALVAIGTATGATMLAGGAAHAQSSSSITITGMAQGGTVGSPEPEVLVSVTCPSGAQAQLTVTALQGSLFHGTSSEFTCTGNPQNETVGTTVLSGSGSFIFAGPVSAGATMWVANEPSAEVGTTTDVTYP
jgi:hypothetical protein